MLAPTSRSRLAPKRPVVVRPGSASKLMRLMSSHGLLAALPANGPDSKPTSRLIWQITASRSCSSEPPGAASRQTPARTTAGWPPAGLSFVTILWKSANCCFHRSNMLSKVSSGASAAGGLLAASSGSANNCVRVFPWTEEAACRECGLALMVEAKSISLTLSCCCMNPPYWGPLRLRVMAPSLPARLLESVVPLNRDTPPVRSRTPASGARPAGLEALLRKSLAADEEDAGGEEAAAAALPRRGSCCRSSSTAAMMSSSTGR
mmetsp:Transcript_14159/g.41301  ORF Transcript_14159/g.41301 Transcript_14159/m.41301 type:complete len:263 (-) Transcript_14159:319-1107(-)